MDSLTFSIMIVDEKKIKNCKILSNRYKILKSNFQELRSLMYTLVKREFDIYNINNRDLTNIRIVVYIYELIEVVTCYIEEKKLG